MADQLTLSRPGGTHYPHPVLLAPPKISDLATALHLSPKSDYQNVFFGNDSKIGLLLELVSNLLLFNIRCVVQLQICQIENERTLSNCPN